MNRQNDTMLCDLYELTMANGYFSQGLQDQIAYFDVFFRRIPDGGGFVIAAGLEQAADYVQALRFTTEDIEYLRGLKLFSAEFLDYLRMFSFHGDIYAVPEGTPVFPQEPIAIVRAPLIEAQLLETFLLLAFNHQSLIATKANRLVRAAAGRVVLDFGARCAQGVDAAVIGARAAFIGGCGGTSCMMSGRDYGIPVGGTMAHSWVQIFDDELEAFKAYCALYPDNVTLLVDTYDVLNSGVPNAIRAFEAVLSPLSIRRCAIRIDSGDIAALSISARAMLDAAGWTECRIVASNALDEKQIAAMLDRGAQVDTFGVGECLITAKSDPVLGCVYKLAAKEDRAGRILPRIKISDSPAKLTTPCFKRVYRLYNRTTGDIQADYVCVYDEPPPDAAALTRVMPDGFDAADCAVRPLLTPIFQAGRRSYPSLPLPDIQSYCRERINALPAALMALEPSKRYPVVFSAALTAAKQEMIRHCSGV